MLTTSDLASMRMMQENALPETCNIQARSLIGDGQGGQREVWSTGIPRSCRIAPMSPEDVAQYADKLGTASGWVITLVYDAGVEVYDKLVVNDVEYRVIGTNDNESWQTAQRVYCRRVE